MGELKSSYDVTIVGTDLPALIFGALAAKNGYRVLLLGHGGRNNVYEEDGFRFVRRPNLMYGFTDALPISEVFRELALLPEMRNRPRQFDPICNVVMPERRLEISHVKDSLSRELQREFPGQAGRIQNLLVSMTENDPLVEPLLRNLPPAPPEGIGEFFKWRRARRDLLTLAGNGDVMEPLDGNAAARAFLAAPAAVLTGSITPWENPLTFCRTISHLMRGLYNVEWGIDSLKSLFLARIEGNSGTVRAGDFADVIQVRRGRIVEVDVLGRNESIGTSFLVAGTDLDSIAQRLPEKVVKKRWQQRLLETAASHCMITMNIGMARQGLPVGMARNVFLVDDPARPLEGDNLLVIQVDPAMEPADTVDPERAVLSVSGLMRRETLHGPESIEAFCATMMVRIRAFMPFLDRHLIVTSIPSVRTSEKTGKEVIDQMSVPLVGGSPMPGMLGLVTRPIRTPVSNMVCLADSSCGTLGFEGAFTAAHMAFGMLKKKLPRKDVIQGAR